MRIVLKTKILLFKLAKALAIVPFPVKRTRFIFSFLTTALLVFSHGCGDDADVAVVDFSKTVVVEQPKEPLPEDHVLRVAVSAMVSPKETLVYYRQLLDYIGSKLGRNVQLIQRKTYGEINELIGKGQIDLGLVCSGPYVTGREKYGFELLAVPQVHGKHFYQSYLIVNKNSTFHKLEDLRGQVFAFTDPESNTGKLVPTYWLMKVGERPETFFSKTIYTYSHDNSILAVARALADGAAVDGLIWEYYNHKNPVFTSKTRIIKKSEPYGIPPLVVSRHLAPELKGHLSEILFSTHQDPEGRKILEELMIDRFVPPKEEWYNSIRKMEQDLRVLKDITHAATEP
jgi:phosphonate transport system substrate-binding protein